MSSHRRLHHVRESSLVSVRLPSLPLAFLYRQIGRLCIGFRERKTVSSILGGISFLGFRVKTKERVHSLATARPAQLCLVGLLDPLQSL